ncbi:hypothetical protein TNCV_498261 [Trichonephila clavipes]|nr:hypothetical protein TNCV_498261 [Trichonephila clavipes]
MHKSNWAIYCHYRSTDEEPMHYFCPIGAPHGVVIKRRNPHKTHHTIITVLCPPLLWMQTATAGSDVVQSVGQIFDDFFQHLWPYFGTNTANVVFQMVKRLWLIRIDQLLYIGPQKIV